MNFRDYLRDSLPVEEEKMTHGHADENSIVSLMSGGSILLRDGGYRDYMPSGPFGAYRQDYFHNRLVIRPEKIFMGQSKGDLRYARRRPSPRSPCWSSCVMPAPTVRSGRARWISSRSRSSTTAGPA